MAHFKSLLLPSLISLSHAVPTQQHKSNTFPPEHSVEPSLEWGDCPSELLQAGVPDTLVCATYSVPIDWDEPYGEHFDLELVKLPAATSNSSTKIGSLSVNLGGPGGLGAEFVATIAATAAAGLLPVPAYQELLSSFDWIRLNSRGVGSSGQVQCDMSVYAERVSLFPKTQEEFDALKDKNKRLGELCLELTGPLLKHIDTISVVKDFGAVRIALDNKPINFLGLSYGSQIGAQYAALFPDNHSQGETANVLIEASSYALGLTHFFDWACQNESSPLKGQDVEEFWYSLLSNATETPIPAAGCNDTNCRANVNAEEILFATQPYLVYVQHDELGIGSWAYLASALYDTSQGDATPFSTYLDPTMIEVSSALAGTAIACLDWTSTPTLASSIRKQVLGQQLTPLNLGASQSWGIQYQCIRWPAPVANPPEKLDVQSEATNLLVQSETDPDTGYPWAVGMTEEIEKNVLVTRKGDGHTCFALDGETTEVIAKYLITGEAPEEELVLNS